MQSAFIYDKCMPNIQVRNVPEELHRTLKAKAALEGISLSAFLLSELEMIAERPTRREFLQRLRTREPVHLGQTAVEIIRELRERD